MIRQLSLYASPWTDPYRNLALEEWLLERVGQGELCLYLWRNQSTVVIGRNQNARAQCRLDLLSREGGCLARRLSGGGAVFHDLGNLNFTFLAREGAYDLPRQLSVIREAVGRFGITTQQSGRNDLLAEGRKFSGNAFYQRGDRRYHHGTLLVEADMERMLRYLTPDPAKLSAKGVDSVRSRVINLSALCPGLSPAALGGAMEEAFAQVYGLPAQRPPLPQGEALEAGRERYASYAWLFGREPPFTLTTDSPRFSWGSAQLCLVVEEGLVKEAVLYTDAMDPELAPLVAQAIHGARCAGEALAARLRQRAERYPALATQLLDIAGLLEGEG